VNGSGVEVLDAVFARARDEQRGVLIPYLCAGDPDTPTSEALLETIATSGVDAIELGIPYGDPLADGPTIAAAAQRALEGGASLEGALEMARRAHERGAPPILFFTYFNPIVQFGLERFAAACVAAGAAGAIVPDLPLEESGPLREAFRQQGLAMPQLIAPTTPPERALRLAELSDGFVYLVSRLGVTSASREPDFEWVARRVAALRRGTRRPIVVGFGIATPDHVRSASELADGAIVGSALIDAYAGLTGSAAVARVRTLVAALIEGRRLHGS
jgi:tryptophan synthase alpha chain